MLFEEENSRYKINVINDEKWAILLLLSVFSLESGCMMQTPDLHSMGSVC